MKDENRYGMGGNLAVLLALAGCAGDPAADPVLPGADAGPGSTPRGSSCPNPAVPDGELQNRAQGSSVFGMTIGGEPGPFDAMGGTECGLPGVRVCVLGTATCTESDVAGQFVLGGLPENQDVEIAFEAPEVDKAIRLVQTGTGPVNLRQTRLVTSRGSLELLEQAGVAVDATKSLVIAIPIAPGEGIGSFVLPAGVTLALEPRGAAALYSVGIEGEKGLSSDVLDPALAATRFGGWGLFANVDPGDYAVRFEREGRVCDTPLPGYGYGTDDEGNIRVRVVAGYHTVGVAAFCQ